MSFHDRFYSWLAWHLPRPLVYWAAVRLLSEATVGPWSGQIVGGLKAVDALQRWKGK